MNEIRKEIKMMNERGIRWKIDDKIDEKKNIFKPKVVLFPDVFKDEK